MICLVLKKMKSMEQAIPVFVEMPFGKKQIFATSLSGRVCKQNIIFKNRNCRLDESIKTCQFAVLGQIAIGSNGWGLLLFTFTFFSSAHFPKCRWKIVTKKKESCNAQGNAIAWQGIVNFSFYYSFFVQFSKWSMKKNHENGNNDGN